MIKIVLFLFGCFFIVAVTQGQLKLTGYWRMIKPVDSSKSFNDPHPVWGDLVLNADSSFHIEGKKDTVKIHSPGWNIGNSMNGKWELWKASNKKQWKLHLVLAPYEDRLFINYLIVRCTSTTLQLRSAFNPTNSKHDIILKRIRPYNE